MADSSEAGLGVLEKDDLIPDARLREGEPDAFRHAPIAARLAELAINADTPVNVALFGPWGSGKSSFFELLRCELAKRDAGVELVRYDAWKYGGGALKRNFISSAATELGMGPRKPDARKFHRGLYENKRTVQFDPLALFRQGEWKSWVKVLFGALLAASTAVVVLALWVSVFSDKDVSDEIGRLAPGIGTTIGGLVLALGAALKILDGAKVEVEQVVPSQDEQFADLFNDLVSVATKRSVVGRSRHRLVFFIDELDRCSKDDVVSTLTSLRTFLDQENCVFVVAADRDVLETALDVVPQATPMRDEEPYYSSASAFLDKIFQHQFSLPPLRGGRLTGFARELVIGRGGLWGDLRKSNSLNDVLYTLIPAHVRAPRRVKVLLNNFATNVRVSEARGIDWLNRSEEIAKLTVLQTEFPRLAGDLYEEPRLLEMLLSPPASPTDRQKVLLERHWAVANTVAEGVEDEDEKAPPGYVAPDRLLTVKPSEALLSRQREDLHRYLQSRTARDPGRDLLYLETVGSWLGLEDAELNRIIEDEAPSRPDLVVSALVDRPVNELLAAARLLGYMSEREFGPERRNIMTAMTGALAASSPDDLDDLGDLVQNVASYRAEQEPTVEQLPGMLVLAIAAGDHGRDLAAAVLASDTIFDDPNRLTQIARLLPALERADASNVEEAIARAYLDEPNILLDVIRAQPPVTVNQLIDTAAPIVAEELRVDAAPAAPAPPAPAASQVATIEAPSVVGPDAETVLDRSSQLLDALDERGEELFEAKARLLAALLEAREATTYAACRERGVDVASQIQDADLRNRILLAGLLAGPADDWQRWSEPLVQPSEGRQDYLCEHAVMSVLTALPTVGVEIQTTAPAALRQIILADPAVRPDDPNSTVLILTTITQQLGASNWWLSDAATATQLALYEVAHVLAGLSIDLSTAIAEALRADLLRAAPATVAWDSDIARRFADLAIACPDAVLTHADAAAASASGEGVVLARLRIAERLQESSMDATPLGVDEIIAAAAASGRAADEVAATWLRLNPAPSDVVRCITALSRVLPRTSQSLRDRSGSMTPADASNVFLGFVDADADSGWLDAVAPNVDNQVVLPALADRMSKAAGSKREAIAKAVSALTLTNQTERQGVGQIALALLADAPNQSKSEVAASLISLIYKERYGLKTQIVEAVAQADQSSKLGNRARSKFENMGLLVRKRRKLRIFGIELP